MRISFEKISKFILVIPILLGWSAGENWLVRALAVTLFLVVFVAVFSSMVISSNFRFVGRRLANRSRRARLTMEVFFRTIMFGLVIYIADMLFYFCWDWLDIIKRGYPIRTEVTVTQEHSTGLTWALGRGLDLSFADGKVEEYDLWLQLKGPEQGRQYEAVLFPKSKCVLSLRPG